MLPIIAAIAKSAVGKTVGKMIMGKIMGGTSEEGTSSPGVSINDINNNISQQMSMMNQDKGFYSHMTVNKAKKGRKVKIIGRGD